MHSQTIDQFVLYVSWSLEQVSLMALLWGYTPCTIPYSTSYLCHVMLSYVVYIILYCNDDRHVKDGVVHHSRQQSLVAKWLGLGVYS